LSIILRVLSELATAFPRSLMELRVSPAGQEYGGVIVTEARYLCIFRIGL
jgi:hypothetical protein